jgi:mono/diheme cytochrome c family protein
MKPLSRRRKIALGAVAVIAVVGAIAAWIMLPPRALGFAGGAAVPLADYKGASPVGVPAELSGADQIRRGEYLTKAADCEVCHTAEGGQPFAGGRAFPTPFGVLYSPNITADRQTGIGAWSDAAFIRAVHEGVAEDGQPLYPAFPYESYTLLADDDVRAIKAYLFSLPLAHASAPPNQLAFPFNQRWLMRVWAAFYNPNQRFQPHPDRSPAWNRGAYLAEGLAHCGDCHTPRNLAQALDNRRKFAGALTAGWRAYNITADQTSGVGEWSDAALADYLRSGHALGHGSAGGPMAEEVDVSLSTLSPSDLGAVVTYLRSIPAIRTPEPALKAGPASDMPKLMQANFDPRGKQIFEGACASCHSWSGVSLLTNYATLTGDRAVNDPSGVNVAQIVISGQQRGAADGGVVTMPAFGAAYSDTEIAAVANYVTARFGAPSQLSAKDVAQLRRASSK